MKYWLSRNSWCTLRLCVRRIDFFRILFFSGIFGHRFWNRCGLCSLIFHKLWNSFHAIWQIGFTKKSHGGRMKNENANPYFRQQFPSSHMIRLERTEIGSKRIVGNKAAAPKPTNEETKIKKNATHQIQRIRYKVACMRENSEWIKRKEQHRNESMARSINVSRCGVPLLFSVVYLQTLQRKLSKFIFHRHKLFTIDNSMEATRMHTYIVYVSCTRERNTGKYTRRSLFSSTSRHPQKTKGVE